MPRLTPSRLLRTAGRSLVTAALVVAVGLLGAAALPRLAGFTPMLILSGSMGPAAPVGSVVLGRDVDARLVRVGDILLLPRPGATPVLHRVTEVGRTEGRVVVRTRGDANEFADPEPTVLPARVVSAVYVVPRIGYLLRLVATPVGWVGFVLLPAAALCAVFLVRVWATVPPPRTWSLAPPAPSPATRSRARAGSPAPPADHGRA